MCVCIKKSANQVKLTKRNNSTYNNHNHNTGGLASFSGTLAEARWEGVLILGEAVGGANLWLRAGAAEVGEAGVADVVVGEEVVEEVEEVEEEAEAAVVIEGDVVVEGIATVVVVVVAEAAVEVVGVIVAMAAAKRWRSEATLSLVRRIRDSCWSFWRSCI